MKFSQMKKFMHSLHFLFLAELLVPYYNGQIMSAVVNQSYQQLVHSVMIMAFILLARCRA